MAHTNCENTLKFITEVLSKQEKNPISRFERDMVTFDFEKESNNKLWNFLIIKSCEPDSELRGLTSTILKNVTIDIMPEITNSAALNLARLTLAEEHLKTTADKINNMMKGFNFEEKVVLKNEAIEDNISWNAFILSKSPIENLKKAKELLLAISTSNEVFNKIHTALESFIAEKETVRKFKLS